MKKYYSFAMVALSAIAALSSCKKEFIEPEAVCADGPSFVAILDEEAKTTIDGTKIYWKDGDEVSVNGKLFVAAVDPENKAKATFTLKAGQTAPEAFNNLYHIYYPASAYVANYPARYKLGNTQTFAGDDISGVNPMYAQAADLNGTIQFKNVCGLLAVKAKGTDKIASVAVTAPSGNYLYGTLSNFAYSEGAISYSNFTTTGRGAAVTLNCGTGGAQLKADEATTFYIALPEKEYSKLTITFTTTAGKKKSFESSKACPVVKNHIFGIPETIDFNVNFNATIDITKNEAISAGVANLGYTVTPTDQNIYYVYCCESKAYVDTFNGDDAALAAADIAWYKQQGASTLALLESKGYATKGTKALTATATPGADMYIYAFGVDADLNVSPAVKVPVKVAEFSLPTCSAQYSDYIGDWKLGSSIITISEKVNGSTYNVTGLKNQDTYSIPAVEASFENGNLILNEQKTSATVTNSYGVCDLYLSGVFAQGGKTYGYFPLNSSTGTDPQMIFYGQYASDKITVYPGGCSYGSFIEMGFSWVIRSGTNAGKGNTYAGNALADMTKYSVPVCTAQYSDYIGEWVCGTEVIKIEEKVNGSTYNVTGIKNQDKYAIPAVEASYEDGNFILKEQKTSATTSVGTYGLCDLYLSGIEDGEETGNYPILAPNPATIFIGQYENDVIKVIPNFEAMGFSWVIQSGSYAGNGNTYAGTTIVDMPKFVAPTGPTPEGTWYCASGVDLWNEPFADWTITIDQSGAAFAISDFDIAFAAYKTEDAVATWDATAQTLTIAAGAPTGLSASGVSVAWVGLDDNMYTTDIVLKVDFDAKTIINQTAWGAAGGTSLYSGYPKGGCVWVKQEAATSSVKTPSISNSARIKSVKELQRNFVKANVNSKGAEAASIKEFSCKKANINF